MKYAVVGEKTGDGGLGSLQRGRPRLFYAHDSAETRRRTRQSPPREVVFLVDVSGSMRGEPTEKVKEAMRHFFRLSKPNDTVQVITFAGSTNKLFEKPVQATEENVGPRPSLHTTDSRRRRNGDAQGDQDGAQRAGSPGTGAHCRDAHGWLHRQRVGDYCRGRQARRRPNSILGNRHRFVAQPFFD